MKLSAASPQCRFSHSMLASYPPAAAITARPRMSSSESPSFTRTASNRLFSMIRSSTRHVIADGDPHARRRSIISVQQRFAAAQKPPIGSSQMKRSGQRLLPAHTMRAHPCGKLARFAHGKLGKIEIGGRPGDADQVFQMLLFGIGPEKNWSAAACVQRILRVWRVFPPRMCSGARSSTRTRAPHCAGRQRRAQCGVPASDHDDVVRLPHISPGSQCVQERFTLIRESNRFNGESLNVRLLRSVVPAVRLELTT